MAERIISLSIDNLFNGNHNHPDISRFIADFSSAIYADTGKKPEMLGKLGIGPDFPVRLLVGLPQKTMTRAQRLAAEAYCATIFGRKLGDTGGLWSYRAIGWRPTNPRRKPATIADSMLDTDYMLGTGIPKSVWCNDILFSSSAFNKTNVLHYSTLMRYFLALAAYGFHDPYPFFTENTDRSPVEPPQESPV
jgi:hypothetical protein